MVRTKKCGASLDRVAACRTEMGELVYYSAIGMLAFVLLLIENQDIFLHKGGGFAQPAWKVYRRFLYAVLVYYITDILWGFLQSAGLGQLVFIDTSAYFIAMAIGVALCCQYIVAYLDEGSAFERFLISAGRVIAGVTVGVTLINIVHPILFVVSATADYEPLGLRYILLGSQIVLLFLITLYAYSSIIRQRPARKRRLRLRTLGLLGLIMGIFLILQLLYPLLPMYAAAYLLGTSLIRSFVIGDEKEEYRHELAEATKIAELRQSITSLLDNMPAMSFSKDVEKGVYLACNQAFADFAHKQTPAEVVGLTDHDLFDQQTADHFVEDDRVALAMDEPYVFYEDVLDAAGNPCKLQTTKLQFSDSLGRRCLLGMTADITEAEQAKDAYRQAISTSSAYWNIVDALSGDYFNLYYIDLATNAYVEYGLRTKAGHQAAERHGTDFFKDAQANARAMIYPDDLKQFVAILDKEKLLREVDKTGTFIFQYRLMVEGEPTYMNLKATRATEDDSHLIIGISNIDAQLKDRAAAMHAREDQKSYLRLSALNGNLIVLYYVDLATDHYTEFGATKEYDQFGIAKQGDAFFAETYENSLRAVYPEDQELFHSVVTKENILRTIERDSMFAFDYRLMRGGQPTYVRLKAAKLEEEGTTLLIIGLLDEDAQVRRELEYAHDLSVAKRLATIDALTGVKNKYAYAQWEERVDASIKAGTQEPFAVVVCDINDLKLVNDRYGHKAGDACIKNACARICAIFDHSPVFRVGGDEFVVLLTGEDFVNRDQLMEELNELPDDLSTIRVGETISAGMVEYDPTMHSGLISVFVAADRAMYVHKQQMKQGVLAR